MSSDVEDNMICTPEEDNGAADRASSVGTALSWRMLSLYFRFGAWVLFAIVVQFPRLQGRLVTALIRYHIKTYMDERGNSCGIIGDRADRSEGGSQNGALRTLRHSETGTHPVSIAVGRGNIFFGWLGDIKISLSDGTALFAEYFSISMRMPTSNEIRVSGDPRTLVVLCFAGVRVYPPEPAPVGGRTANAKKEPGGDADSSSSIYRIDHADSEEHRTALTGRKRGSSANNVRVPPVLTRAIEWVMRFVAVEVADLRVELPEVVNSTKTFVNAKSARPDHVHGKGRQLVELADHPASASVLGSGRSKTKDHDETRGCRVRFVELKGFNVSCLLSSSSATLKVFGGLGTVEFGEMRRLLQSEEQGQRPCQHNNKERHVLNSQRDAELCVVLNDVRTTAVIGLSQILDRGWRPKQALSLDACAGGLDVHVNLSRIEEIRDKSEVAKDAVVEQRVRQHREKGYKIDREVGESTSVPLGATAPMSTSSAPGPSLADVCFVPTSADFSLGTFTLTCRDDGPRCGGAESTTAHRIGLGELVVTSCTLPSTATISSQPCTPRARSAPRRDALHGSSPPENRDGIATAVFTATWAAVVSNTTPDSASPRSKVGRSSGRGNGDEIFPDTVPVVTSAQASARFQALRLLCRRCECEAVSEAQTSTSVARDDVRERLEPMPESLVLTNIVFVPIIDVATPTPNPEPKADASFEMTPLSTRPENIHKPAAFSQGKEGSIEGGMSSSDLSCIESSVDGDMSTPPGGRLVQSLQPPLPPRPPLPPSEEKGSGPFVGSDAACWSPCSNIGMESLDKGSTVESPTLPVPSLTSTHPTWGSAEGDRCLNMESSRKFPPPLPPRSSPQEEPPGAGDGVSSQNASALGAPPIRSPSPTSTTPRPGERDTEVGFMPNVVACTFEAETADGVLDAGLVEWLNLRGRWEAEEATREAARYDFLEAYGLTTDTRSTSRPRLNTSIKTVRVTVEEAAPPAGAETTNGGDMHGRAGDATRHGRFEIEVDGLESSQERSHRGLQPLPVACTRLVQALGKMTHSIQPVRDNTLTFKCSRAAIALAEEAPSSLLEGSLHRSRDRSASSESENSPAPHVSKSPITRRLQLEMFGVSTSKVMEKGSCGRSARGSTVVSCRKVFGHESVNEPGYGSRVATVEDVSFTQVRVAGCPKKEIQLDDDRDQSSHSSEHIVDEDAVEENTVSEMALSARSGSKSEEIVVGNADVAWSGSVHCGFIQMAKRLVGTIDHVIGLPPPPPPKEFTRSVLVREGDIHCAFSAVLQDSVDPPPPSRYRSERTSDFDGEDEMDGLWCRHRLNVRLQNLLFVSAKKIPTIPVAEALRPPLPSEDDGVGVSAAMSRPDCEDVDISIKADELDVLVPTVAVPVGTSARVADIGTTTMENEKDSRGRSSELARGSANAESEQSFTRETMTRIAAIELFSYKKSLSWVSRSTNCRGISDGTQSAVGPISAGRSEDSLGDAQAEGPGEDDAVDYGEGLLRSRLWSVMSIEVCTGRVHVNLIQENQLGNLQAAALVQWKGVQAVLGEPPSTDVADECSTLIVLGDVRVVFEDKMVPRLRRSGNGGIGASNLGGNNNRNGSQRRESSADSSTGSTSSFEGRIARAAAAATDRTDVFSSRDRGRETSNNRPASRETGNYDQLPDGSARTTSVAILRLGGVNFKASRKEPQHVLHKAVRALDEHPGTLLYGQTMGGWGALSVAGATVTVPGMAVPLFKAEQFRVDGLFARVALAGTEHTRFYDFSRLSSSSISHPLALAMAKREMSNVRENDGEEWTIGERRRSDVSLGVGKQAGLGPGGDHVGFAVVKDGTTPKIYLDLQGDVSGVSVVYGRSLDHVLRTLIEALARLTPQEQEGEEEELETAEGDQGQDKAESSLPSCVLKESSSNDGDEGSLSSGYETCIASNGSSKRNHDHQRRQQGSRRVCGVPPVEIWDKLRSLLHGKVSLGVEGVEGALLLGPSPAELEACLRLHVSRAQIDYSLGHVDLQVRHALVSCPAKPAEEILQTEPCGALNHVSNAQEARVSMDESVAVLRSRENPRRDRPLSSQLELSSVGNRISTNGETKNRPALESLPPRQIRSGADESVKASKPTARNSGRRCSADTGRYNAFDFSGHSDRKLAGSPPCDNGGPTALSPAAAPYPERRKVEVRGGELLRGFGFERSGYSGEWQGRCGEENAKGAGRESATLFEGGETAGEGAENYAETSLYGSRHSVAFLTGAHLSVDMAWSCAGGNANAHHIEEGLEEKLHLLQTMRQTPCSSSTGAMRTAAATEPALSTPRDLSSSSSATHATNVDMWAPYRAAGLSLTIALGIAPNAMATDGPRCYERHHQAFSTQRSPNQSWCIRTADEAELDRHCPRGSDPFDTEICESAGRFGDPGGEDNRPQDKLCADSFLKRSRTTGGGILAAETTHMDVDGGAGAGVVVDNTALHVFSSGCWLAVRLDLLSWLMVPPAVTAAESSTSTPIVVDTEDKIDEPLRLSSLVTSVEASADVRGFALASWRSAENRDGFVWDIVRTTGHFSSREDASDSTNASDGEGSESLAGGINWLASDLHLDAVRLSLLHINSVVSSSTPKSHHQQECPSSPCGTTEADNNTAAKGSGNFNGSAFFSKTFSPRFSTYSTWSGRDSRSYGRRPRKSRLWIGKRSSSQEEDEIASALHTSSASVSASEAPTRVDEDGDDLISLFSSLDRALTEMNPKHALLRAKSVEIRTDDEHQRRQHRQPSTSPTSVKGSPECSHTAGSPSPEPYVQARDGPSTELTALKGYRSPVVVDETHPPTPATFAGFHANHEMFRPPSDSTLEILVPPAARGDVLFVADQNTADDTTPPAEHRTFSPETENRVGAGGCTAAGEGLDPTPPPSRSTGFSQELKPILPPRPLRVEIAHGACHASATTSPTYAGCGDDLLPAAAAPPSPSTPPAAATRRTTRGKGKRNRFLDDHPEEGNGSGKGGSNATLRGDDVAPTIIVDGLQTLWTVEIRDAVFMFLADAADACYRHDRELGCQEGKLDGSLRSPGVNRTSKTRFRLSQSPTNLARGARADSRRASAPGSLSKESGYGDSGRVGSVSSEKEDSNSCDDATSPHGAVAESKSAADSENHGDGFFSSAGGMAEAATDSGSLLLDWFNNLPAVSGTQYTEDHSPESPTSPRSSPGRGRSSPFSPNGPTSHGFSSPRAGRGGMPGALGRFELLFKIRLINPQVKLMGDLASVIVAGETADVECRTYDTCIAVAGEKQPSRSLQPLTGVRALLRRKEFKVGLEGARVFSVPTNVDDADRWAEYEGRDGSRGRQSASPGTRFWDEKEQEQDRPTYCTMSPSTSPTKLPADFSCRGRSSRRSRHDERGLIGEADTVLGLREVMKPFTASALYVFHEPLSANESEQRLEEERGGNEGVVRHYPRPPANRFLLNIPFLSADMDSAQFFEVFDVYRNLMIAPFAPAELRTRHLERKRRKRMEGCIDAEKAVGKDFWSCWRDRRDKDEPHNVGSKSDRTHLQELVERVQHLWEHGRRGGAAPPTGNYNTVNSTTRNACTPTRSGSPRMASISSPFPGETSPRASTTSDGAGPTLRSLSSAEGVAKELTRIECRIGRCTWKLAMGSRAEYKGEATADELEVGLTGLSACHEFVAQGAPGYEIMVRNDLAQVDRLWVRNLSPSEEDGTPAFIADPREVLSPKLDSTAPCQACGRHFAPEENEWDSCRIHGMDDGSCGEFIADGGPNLPAQGGTEGRWTCCGARHERARGCTPRPHMPKEIMISLRAEGAPPVLVGNTKISVFKHFELNVLPSVTPKLAIFLRYEVSQMLKQYFQMEEDDDTKVEHQVRGQRSFMPLRQNGSGRGGNRGGESSPDRMNGWKQVGEEIGARTFGRRGSTGGSPDQGEGFMSPSRDHKVFGEDEDDDMGMDCVYIKYLRMGGVRLLATLRGFPVPINFDQLEVPVEAWSKHSKLTDWNRLCKKVRNTFGVAVIKSGAKATLVPKVPKWVRGAKNLPSSPTPLPSSPASSAGGKPKNQAVNAEARTTTADSSLDSSHHSRIGGEGADNERRNNNPRGRFGIFRRKSSPSGLPAAEVSALVDTGSAGVDGRRVQLSSGEMLLPRQLPRNRRSSKQGAAPAQMDEEVLTPAASVEARTSSANLLLPSQPAKGKKLFRSEKGIGATGGGPRGLFRLGRS